MEYLAKNSKSYAIGLIDECDIDIIDVFSINLMDTGYARIGRKKLHTLILERKLNRKLKCGYVTDHINRNRLDNRRENLREVINRVNVINKERIPISGRKCFGSTFLKKKNRWQAQIKINQKHVYLGLFKTEAEAQECYIKKAKEIGYL